MKTKSITLKHTDVPAAAGSEKRYRVVSCKNSTDHQPGQYLTPKQVDAMCVDRNWEVTIR